jgi:hypothetical protein
MESNLNEFECDLCLGDKACFDGFHGVTLAYATSVRERESVTLCEYTLTPIATVGPKDDPRETRAVRHVPQGSTLGTPEVGSDPHVGPFRAWLTNLSR